MRRNLGRSVIGNLTWCDHRFISLSVSVLPRRTYRAKHIARLLEPALSRSRINRLIRISLSILLFLLSNRLLKITRGVSTPRSNNQKLWLISQSSEFVVFLCPILSHRRFFSLSDILVVFPNMHDNSYFIHETKKIW